MEANILPTPFLSSLLSDLSHSIKVNNNQTSSRIYRISPNLHMLSKPTYSPLPQPRPAMEAASSTIWYHLKPLFSHFNVHLNPLEIPVWPSPVLKQHWLLSSIPRVSDLVNLEPKNLIG